MGVGEKRVPGARSARAAPLLPSAVSSPHEFLHSMCGAGGLESPMPVPRGRLVAAGGRKTLSVRAVPEVQRVRMRSDAGSDFDVPLAAIYLVCIRGNESHISSGHSKG